MYYEVTHTPGNHLACSFDERDLNRDQMVSTAKKVLYKQGYFGGTFEVYKYQSLAALSVDAAEFSLKDAPQHLM